MHCTRMQAGGSCILLDRPVRDGGLLLSHYAYFVLRRDTVTQRCKLYCVMAASDLYNSGVESEEEDEEDRNKVC